MRALISLIEQKFTLNLSIRNGWLLKQHVREYQTEDEAKVQIAHTFSRSTRTRYLDPIQSR